MRVFLTGGTGALGAYLVPSLLDAGHEVVALARNPRKAKWLSDRGAEAAVADPLEPRELAAAISGAGPDVVMHQLTALASAGNLKGLDRDFALTNRFRTEVTDTLIEAAQRAGSRRFVAQSFCGWPYAREGGPIKSEDHPLDPDPPANFSKTLAAIRHLESAVLEAKGLQGLVLRYGFFYGPGTGLSSTGDLADMVIKRRLPIVGNGAGVWSFVHIEDAAAAAVSAVTQGSAGFYNVADDEPAPVVDWLPFLAQALGARPPRRIPRWIGRLAIGEGGVAMMNSIRGASNSKAKRELGWKPRYSSWREGFVNGLG